MVCIAQYRQKITAYLVDGPLDGIAWTGTTTFWQGTRIKLAISIDGFGDAEYCYDGPIPPLGETETTLYYWGVFHENIRLRPRIEGEG